VEQMKNLIGISGKIGSGKDTVAAIIQELYPQYEVKKFAGKLKDIASILTGIPVEKFEDQEFKKTDLGKEWSYAYPDQYYDDL
jgi:dephospho-CoA kinase